MNKIIPVTLDYTVLCAELADGEIVRGESTIPVRENREPIKRVFFEPRENGKTHHSPHEIYECQAHEGAVEALFNADVIPHRSWEPLHQHYAQSGYQRRCRNDPAFRRH